jgi:acetyltransferase
VSLGEHADVDFGDMLDWLASDARTRAILLYIESIEAPRKFMSAARAAARNKPVLVVKAGRSAQGQQAAASHTGALASADIVFDAAIRRAGMLRVDTLQELFVAAEALAHYRGAPANRPARAADAADQRRRRRRDGRRCRRRRRAGTGPLPPATLRRAGRLPAANWSHGNPVDIIGDAPVERYVQTLQALLADPDTGTLLFMHAPTAIVPSADIARALLPLAGAEPRRLVSCWLGGPGWPRRGRSSTPPASPATTRPSRRCAPARCWPPTGATRNSCCRRRRRAPRALGRARPARVREIIAAVLGSGREMLTEPEAKALLQAAGIPVVATEVVGPDPAEAAAAAASAIGYPVVLKILSRDISHKSDVGGVVLQLETEAEVRQAAEAMLARVRGCAAGGGAGLHGAGHGAAAAGAGAHRRQPCRPAVRPGDPVRPGRHRGRGGGRPRGGAAAAERAAGARR